MLNLVFAGALSIATAIAAGSVSAQVTAPVLPGPETLQPIVMEPGLPSVQTVRIIDGKLFPPKLYVRLLDTVRFENRSDTVQVVRAPDDSWTSGDIDPGGYYEVTYTNVLGISGNGNGGGNGNTNCNGWINSGGNAYGLADQCAGNTEYTIDSGATFATVQPTFVHTTLEGELSDSVDGWNAYYLVE